MNCTSITRAPAREESSLTPPSVSAKCWRRTCPWFYPRKLISPPSLTVWRARPSPSATAVRRCPLSYSFKQIAHLHKNKCACLSQTFCLTVWSCAKAPGALQMCTDSVRLKILDFSLRSVSRSEYLCVLHEHSSV